MLLYYIVQRWRSRRNMDTCR